MVGRSGGVHRAPPSPRAPNETIVATYDRFAGTYDRFIGAVSGDVRAEAIDRLALDDDDRVLEVGCGPGHALDTLAHRAGRVVALDAAPGMLDRASIRTAGADRADRIELLLGDARALPLADGEFDAVFIEDTLELFAPSALAVVIDECRRVLRPDGRIAAVTMERTGLETDPFVRLYEWLFARVPGVDRVGCRPIYARHALESAGFEVVHQMRHRRALVWPQEVLIARLASNRSACDALTGSP